MSQDERYRVAHDVLQAHHDQNDALKAIIADTMLLIAIVLFSLAPGLVVFGIVMELGDR